MKEMYVGLLEALLESLLESIALMPSVEKRLWMATKVHILTPFVSSEHRAASVEGVFVPIPVPVEVPPKESCILEKTDKRPKA